MMTGDPKILVQRDNLIVKGYVRSLWGKTPSPIPILNSDSRTRLSLELLMIL